MRYNWFIRHCCNHYQKVLGNNYGCPYFTYKDAIRMGEQLEVPGCKCTGKIVISKEKAQLECVKQVHFYK